MNSKIVVGFVLAAILLGGGAWFVASQADDESTNESHQPLKTEQNAPEAKEQGQTETDDAIGSRQCTISSNSELTGKVYSDGAGRFYQEMSMAGNVFNQTLILKDYTYTWASVQGMKVGGKKPTPEGVRPQTTSGEASYGGTKVTYDCTDWVVDEARFAVPTDVQFKE